jgi:hypothetical protein
MLVNDYREYFCIEFLYLEEVYDCFEDFVAVAPQDK